jgi:hypothetical protein
MGLITLMFVLQTILHVILWYQAWFAFIKHGNTPDDVLAALVMADPTATNIAIGTLNDLLGTLRMVIADSIMVRVSALFIPS